MGQATINLGPPHGGQDGRTLSRAMRRGDAIAAKNVVTGRGAIEVRDPVRQFCASASWLGSGDQATFLHALCMLRRGGDAVPYGDADLIFVDVHRGSSTARRRCLFEQNGTPVQAFDGTGGVFSSVVQVGQVLYIIDESNTSGMQKIYYKASAWVSHGIGIAAPTLGAAGVTPINQGSGNFAAGTKPHYRITYYNSTLGVESPASDSELDYAASNTFDIRVDWTASTDPQVDKVRIYRMIEGVDDTWFRIAERANANETYTDQAITATKNYDEQVNLASGTPAPARAACWHRGRMWYAPSDDDGTVVCSELYQPELVDPLNSFDVGGDDGRPVRAMLSLGGYLFVFKTRGVWAISGDGPDTYVSEQVDPAPDCIAPQSVIVTPGGVVLFAGAAGVWRMTNQGAQYIGGPVEQAWSAAAISVGRYHVTACWDEKLQVAIFNVPKNTGYGANQFVYDPAAHDWSIWDIAARGVGAAYGTGSNTPDDVQRAYFVRDGDEGDNDIVRLDTPDDDEDWRDYESTAIDWEWTTAGLDGGSAKRKRFGRATLCWEKGAAADTINLAPAIDAEAMPGTGVTGALNAAQPRLTKDVGRLGDYLRAKIWGSATRRTRIARLAVDAVEVNV